MYSKSRLGKKDYLITLLICILLFATFYLQPISSIIKNPKNTVIVSGDLATPISGENYIYEYFSTWNQHYSYRNSIELFRMLVYWPFVPLAHIPAPALFFIVVALSLHIISAFTAIYFFSQFTNNETQKKTRLIIVVAAIIYAFNPYVFLRNHHMTIRVAYALLPITWAMWIKSTRKESNHLQYLITAMATIIMLIVPHYVIIAGIGIIIILFVNAISNNYRAVLSRAAHILIYSVLLSTPFIIASYDGLTNASVGPSYVPSIENIYLISKDANILNTFTLSTYWVPVYSNATYHSALLFVTIFFVCTLLFAAIYLKRTYLMWLVIIGITLNSYNTPGFRKVLEFATAKFPVLIALLRDASKFLNIYILLILLTAIVLASKAPKKLRQVITVSLILWFILLNAPYVSNLGGDITANTPAEKVQFIRDFNSALSENQTGKVLVIPEYWSRPASWSKNPAGRFTSFSLHADTRDVSSGTMRTTYLQFFSPYYDRPEVCQSDFNNASFVRWLEIHGFKYIYIQKDITGVPESNIDCVINFFKSQPGFSEINSSSTDTIFEMNPFNPIGTYSQLAAADSTYNMLQILGEGTLSTLAPVEQSFTNDSDVAISVHYMNHPKDSIRLIEKTTHYSPNTYWSKAYSTDPLHGELTPYFKVTKGTIGFNDYGAGEAFTSRPGATIYFSYTIKEKSIPKISYLSTNVGGLIEICIDKECKTLNTAGDKNKFVWEELPFTVKEGHHTIMIKNVNGTNAVSMLVFNEKQIERITAINMQNKGTKAIIRSWSKESPTEYQISIQSNDTTYISIPEKYDRAWRAEVNGAEYKPIPVMADITAFKVEEKGDLTIHIYQNNIYTVKWFIVPIATILCVILLRKYGQLS